MELLPDRTGDNGVGQERKRKDGIGKKERDMIP